LQALTSDFTQSIHRLVHRALSWLVKPTGEYEPREKASDIASALPDGEEVTFVGIAC
jgi:hypothetical protein